MTRHGAAAAMFAALAIVWTFPLVTNLSGLVLGEGPGDNLQFVWNFWWVRTAIADGHDVYHTSYMFAPIGSSLALHTLTVLPAVLSATALVQLPVVMAMNLTILFSLFLNGFCAYVLAWRLTGDRGAAVVGGLIFGGSSYLFGHLQGHFNLTIAWTVPLFAIAALEAARGSRGWAAAAGLVLATTMYTDYYYVILQGVMALVIAATTGRSWSVVLTRPGTTGRVKAARVVLALAGCAVVAIAAIVLSGGFNINLPGRAISMHGLFNPLQVFWLLIAVWAWLKFGPRVVMTRTGAPQSLRVPALIALSAFVLAAAPVILAAFRLFAAGDYVTQTYFWRSAPSGIDVGTLLLGPPYHGLFGETVRGLYIALGINRIESDAWLGVLPVLLAVGAMRRLGDVSAVRQWLVIGLVFFVWALGPHLMLFGSNTGMILPGAFLRYVPIVNNARIPGRAMVVVTLALAVLGAMCAARWHPAGVRRPLAIAALAALLLVESLPAPFPVVHLSAPHFYEVLRDRPESGAVCELPLATRDGFGGRGTMNDMAFYYQTIHRRPLVGGYLARQSESITTAYAQDPLLDGLLTLSDPQDRVEPKPLPDSTTAADRLKASGIAFVVLDRSLAPAKLTEYVEKVLPLEPIAREGDRTLYVVK